LTIALSDLPREIVEPIKALSDASRRKIVLMLLGRELSYSEIRDSTLIGKGTLNHHLRVLITAGLIRNYGVESPGTLYSSYYAISEFGRTFMEQLQQVLRPRVRKIVETSTTLTVRRTRNFLTSAAGVDTEDATRAVISATSGGAQ
jgi:DNA-binding transcriptional ArsR family regulator